MRGKCQDLDNKGSNREDRNMKPEQKKKKHKFFVQAEGDVFIKQAVWWHFKDKKKVCANMTGREKST